MTVATERTEWKNSVVLALLKRYDFSLPLSDVIELEAEALVERASDGVSGDPWVTPVEKLAEALNVRVVYELGTNSGFRGLLKREGGRSIVGVKRKGYFRDRFTIAHELAHVYLRRLAGPLGPADLQNTGGHLGAEEEMVVNMLAGAVLMPKSRMYARLSNDVPINSDQVRQIAKLFRVSGRVALRRIAWIRKAVLLTWHEESNPKKDGSEKLARISSVYPNLMRFYGVYIPLHCTSGRRFRPDLVDEALREERDLCGDSYITSLGSLPEGKYYVCSLFWGSSQESFLRDGLIEGRRDNGKVATLIDAGLSLKADFAGAY